MPAERRSGRITGEDVRADDASLSGERDSRAKGRRQRPPARCGGPREARGMTAFLLSPPPPTVALD
jgi:hypothetical protein